VVFPFFQAQDGAGGHFAGRRGVGTQGAPRGVAKPTQPNGGVPDRMTATGTKGIQYA